MTSPEVSLAKALELVAIEVERWRMPPGIARAELVQEAHVRWLQLPGSAAGITVEDLVRSLVGIARNVRREWWRAAARWRRLLDELGRLPAGRVGEAVVDDETDLRAAAVRRLVAFLPREDVEVLFLVRWDGFSWKEAFAVVGVEGEAVVVARRKKILRILSTERVQKSLVGWLERSGLPFPSLPFPSLPSLRSCNMLVRPILAMLAVFLVQLVAVAQNPPTPLTPEQLEKVKDDLQKLLDDAIARWPRNDPRWKALTAAMDTVYGHSGAQICNLPLGQARMMMMQRNRRMSSTEPNDIYLRSSDWSAGNEWLGFSDPLGCYILAAQLLHEGDHEDDDYPWPTPPGSPAEKSWRCEELDAYDKEIKTLEEVLNSGILSVTERQLLKIELATLKDFRRKHEERKRAI